MMWKRAAFATAALGALLVASACDDSSSYGSGYGYGSAGGSALRCGAYKTCGTCTPVYGCGWCATGGTSGTCADGPEDCSTAPGGWTWDPPGCGGGLEGGASAIEGGRTAAQPGIGAGDGGSVDMGDDGGADTDAQANDDAASEAGN
jgi:hypothetical protein